MTRRNFFFILISTIFIACISAQAIPPVRILPLGDSITQSHLEYYGYRYYFWKKMIDRDFVFDIVGSMNYCWGGNPAWPPYNGKTMDIDHEGHGSWRADNILYGGPFNPGYLSLWQQNYTPDIVLLHIGTNDIASSHPHATTVAEIKQIIDTLRADNPNVYILLAKVIPMTRTDPVTGNAGVIILNSYMDGIAAEKTLTNSPVVVVDHYSTFNPATDIRDDKVHPNDSGDRKMANNWAAYMPTAPTLIGPASGTSVGSNGVLLSCQPDPQAATYRLWLGPNQNDMTCIVYDGNTPPNKVITSFPHAQTWWTVQVIKKGYGLGIYSNPRLINAQNVVAREIKNITFNKYYDFIQQAIDDANSGDEIVVNTGLCSSQENINFQGKNIILRTQNPDDPQCVASNVIYGDGINPVVTFNNNGANCVLSGFTIKGGTKGIACNTACPTITNCVISNNTGVGVEAYDLYNRLGPMLKNCLIAKNGGIGLNVINRSAPTLVNCTITDNAGQGVYTASATKANISNSIIWNNTGGSIGASGLVTVTYSNIQGGFTGTGNINLDPCFAAPAQGDYHLRSAAGRWNPDSLQWVTDAVTSPCIDAGDPLADYSDEPSPDGFQINLGYFGGTSQASLSLRNAADLNKDGSVDFYDYALLTSFWMQSKPSLDIGPLPLGNDGIIDSKDLSLIAEFWLSQD